jgi:hypothetical protein
MLLSPSLIARLADGARDQFCHLHRQYPYIEVIFAPLISRAYFASADPTSGCNLDAVRFGRNQKEKNMIKTTSVLGAVAALAVASALMSTQPAAAADGCGPGKYRGPGGACHRFGYGPYPAGYYGPRGNGCPPGYWRGPWGHCRNTPYHGRLPNGSWK